MIANDPAISNFPSTTKLMTIADPVAVSEKKRYAPDTSGHCSIADYDEYLGDIYLNIYLKSTDDNLILLVSRR